MIEHATEGGICLSQEHEYCNQALPEMCSKLEIARAKGVVDCNNNKKEQKNEAELGKSHVNIQNMRVHIQQIQIFSKYIEKSQAFSR